MYLTKIEYDVLYGLKAKKPLKEIREEIEKKYGIHMGMNDPILNSLFVKYGVQYDRVELCQKADLCKVDIVEEENMPYYQYDTSNPKYRKQIAKRIILTKQEILRLSKYINNRVGSDLEEEFAVIKTEYDGLGESSYIRDKEGNVYMLGACIDGEYSNDRELDDWTKE